MGRTTKKVDKGAAPEWSVVIDNVRTSHLLLIGVCLALLVATTFEIRSDADRALAELRSIWKIADSWKQQPAWLDDRLSSRFGKYDVARKKRTSETNLVLEASGGWGLGELNDQQKRLLTRDSIPECRNKICMAASNLAEFRSIWDRLSSPVAVHYVKSAEDTVHITLYEGVSDSFSPPTQASIDRDESLVDVANAPAAGARTATTIQMNFPRLKAGPLYEQGEFTVGSQYRDPKWYVTWRVVTEKELIDVQAIIGEKFDRYWRKGTFQDSFSDLQQFTRNYQDLPFEKIEAIIEGEAKRAVEKLDVGGVKIPLTSLKDWGGWILLALCGWLLIHIAALGDELRSGKTAKMGSWIGLYSSGPSRAAVLASMTILPLVTAALLSQPTLRLLDLQAYRWWFACAALVGLVACGIANVVLLLRIWRSHSFI